jgi:hypothetical protein
MRFRDGAASDTSNYGKRFEEDSAKRSSWRMESFEAITIYINALSVRGEMMRKHYLRILLALIGAAGLGMASEAQEADHIVVKIPYAFVVSGKTLPAGTYSVTRVSVSDTRALLLSNFAERVGVLVTASQLESRSADKSRVSFEQVGGQLFLSQIQTGDHLFTIPVSRAEILEAAAKSGAPTTGGAGSTSGAN